MEARTAHIVNQYTEAYQKLYQRTPSDIQSIDHTWVQVNGARMRLSELEFLTTQLQQEYDRTVKHKKNLVSRLIRWFKG